jgi:phosphoglycolate phosphatase-like HAD superfamily hydrolase
MIACAVSDLNIDLGASWLVGDSTGDLETARRAGLKSILVRTGEGGKDGKYNAEADYEVDNLTAAVDLILARGQ